MNEKTAGWREGWQASKNEFTFEKRLLVSWSRERSTVRRLVSSDMHVVQERTQSRLNVGCRSPLTSLSKYYERTVA